MEKLPLFIVLIPTQDFPRSGVTFVRRCFCDANTSSEKKCVGKRTNRNRGHSKTPSKTKTYSCSTDWRQSKTVLTIDERGSETSSNTPLSIVN